MSNNFFPNTETCFVDLSSNGLNSSFFPVGSAQHLDLNYNILPFLCELLKASTDDSVSPVLTEPPAEFDLTPFTDFTPLTAVGDPRVSLGETMTQTYIYFLPRVIAQTEVRQAGGTQLIDNFICTADGTPIKESKSIPVLLDLVDGKPYQYGAITVPPISATFQELMRIIDPQEVRDYVEFYINSRRISYADDFASFIKKYFPDWTVDSIDVFKLSKYLIVNLKKADKTVYIKYYEDVANKVACLLGLDKINYYLNYQTPTSMGAAAAHGSQIPDYKILMKDGNETKAQNWKNKILNNYSSTPEQLYTSILANSASAIAYFNSISNSLTLSNQVSTVNVVSC
jgi:hypothetical protein